MLLTVELRIRLRFLLDTHKNPQHGTHYCKQHEMHRHGGSCLAFNTVHGKIQMFMYRSESLKSSLRHACATTLSAAF